MQKNYIKTRNIFLFTFVFFLILISFFYQGFSAPDQIEMKITDSNGDLISEILEGKSFVISVYSQDFLDNIFLDNFSVEFNEKKYFISDETENKEINLIAPMVDETEKFLIKTYNDSISINQLITVKDLNQLNIESLSGLVVEKGQYFTVEVTDGNNPLKDIDIYIQNIDGEEYEGKTNENGQVVLLAPNNKEKITVIADYNSRSKGIKSSIELTAQLEENIIDTILKNKFTPVVIALILLIIVIFIVHLRQKKSEQIKTTEGFVKNKTKNKGQKEKIEDKKSNKFDFNNKASTLSDNEVRVNTDKDSKIEEIRISRPKKEKEIVPIESEDDPTKKLILKKKDKLNKNNQDWFAGKDDIKYEINKLTGEIDENGIDKWFEGIDKLKEKIDEKVKKDKKKNKDYS